MVRLFLLLSLVLAAALPAGAAEIVVHQKDKQFSPQSAGMHSGDKIKFLNDDTVAHNVFVTGPGGEAQNSGVQDPGQDTVIAFDKPGTYTIECAIHPKMHMTVTVK